ncbi:hypothetical protein BC629DRAFT_1648258 [Irpex lacteus]|nr:hypothetical protein BC629DRAFT_1648258 [Irpex lacteus]
MLALLCFPAYLICSLFLVAAAPMRKIQGLAPLNVIETVNLQRVTGMKKIVLCHPPRVVGRDVDIQRSHSDVGSWPYSALEAKCDLLVRRRLSTAAWARELPIFRRESFHITKALLCDYHGLNIDLPQAVCVQSLDVWWEDVRVNKQLIENTDQISFGSIRSQAHVYIRTLVYGSLSAYATYTIMHHFQISRAVVLCGKLVHSCALPTSANLPKT